MNLLLQFDINNIFYELNGHISLIQALVVGVVVAAVFRNDRDRFELIRTELGKKYDTLFGLVPIEGEKYIYKILDGSYWKNYFSKYPTKVGIVSAYYGLLVLFYAEPLSLSSCSNNSGQISEQIEVSGLIGLFIVGLLLSFYYIKLLLLYCNIHRVQNAGKSLSRYLGPYDFIKKYDFIIICILEFFITTAFNNSSILINIDSHHLKHIIHVFVFLCIIWPLCSIYIKSAIAENKCKKAMYRLFIEVHLSRQNSIETRIDYLCRKDTENENMISVLGKNFYFNKILECIKMDEQSISEKSLDFVKRRLYIKIDHTDFLTARQKVEIKNRIKDEYGSDRTQSKEKRINKNILLKEIDVLCEQLFIMGILERIEKTK